MGKTNFKEDLILLSTILLNKSEVKAIFSSMNAN